MQIILPDWHLLAHDGRFQCGYCLMSMGIEAEGDVPHLQMGFHHYHDEKCPLFPYHRKWEPLEVLGRQQVYSIPDPDAFTAGRHRFARPRDQKIICTDPPRQCFLDGEKLLGVEATEVFKTMEDYLIAEKAKARVNPYIVARDKRNQEREQDRDLTRPQRGDRDPHFPPDLDGETPPFPDLRDPPPVEHPLSEWEIKMLEMRREADKKAGRRMQIKEDM